MGGRRAWAVRSNPYHFGSTFDENRTCRRGQEPARIGDCSQKVMVFQWIKFVLQAAENMTVGSLDSDSTKSHPG